MNQNLVRSRCVYWCHKIAQDAGRWNEPWASMRPCIDVHCRYILTDPWAMRPLIGAWTPNSEHAGWRMSCTCGSWDAARLNHGRCVLTMLYTWRRRMDFDTNRETAMWYIIPFGCLPFSKDFSKFLPNWGPSYSFESHEYQARRYAEAK